MDMSLKKVLLHLLNRAATYSTVGGVVMLFGINANGNPYMRWTLSGTQYQLLIGTSGITYQKNSGSGWTNVWTNH